MKIYSTLTQRKEEFTAPDGLVRMYVCGITPYDNSHIGHAMSYIIFDTIRRYLEFRGFKVKYVQNLTDIDDKIIRRASEAGVSAKELAEKYIQFFFDDMQALNIRPADVYPRATEEIPKIIDVIQGLVAKEYAYTAGGSVYFRVNRMSDYGKLSHRNLDSMMAGARIEPEEEKEHPMDFALWKASKPGEPWWESPWGKGRPGWHIECSAMSLKYLGETLDIHGGGQDLIFPHHENEIAQSESYTGRKPFARFWLHNGLLQFGAEKMSKSVGNIIAVRDILAKYSSDALHIFVLSSHYRGPLTYSEESLEAAERGAERLRQASNVATSPNAVKKLEIGDYRDRFTATMDDDFNSAQAIAVLFDLAHVINRGADNGLDVKSAQDLLKDLSTVLGLTLKAPPGPPQQAAQFIELLISLRKQLREVRQYQLADSIRSRLAELGVTLEDTPQGTVWKQKIK